METRKSTRAGVLFWTPAPICSSPTNSVVSEDVWEDENEDEAEKDDDFVNQMDENGIIGLSEALEEVELGKTFGDADAEFHPNFYPGPLTPEEADLSGHDRQTSPEELSHNQSDHPSYTKSPREEAQILSPYEKMSPSPSCSATQLTMELAGVSSHHWPVSRPASAVTAPPFPELLHISAEEAAAAAEFEGETIPEMNITESLSESHRSHTSHKSSPRRPEIKVKASVRPASMLSEDLSDHYSVESNVPLKGSVEPDKRHKRLSRLPRKTKQHSSEDASSSRPLSTVGSNSLKCKHKTTSPHRELRTDRAVRNAAVDESGKGPLHYCKPDFSKVEPKVRFPKGGYKPPKSRRSAKRGSLSPEPPVVFKSPADIVKEVLLNITDRSPAPSDSNEPPGSAPDFIVPQEFRSHQHATTLIEQLQEKYNMLLTKHAEAENTIDRLRLEAKVNLYSDAPKPGHLVQSGLNQVSRFMILDFPQAQRADINSDSLNPNGHSAHQKSSSSGPYTRNPDPQVGQQPTRILYSQATKFLQQLQIFDDLLKCQRLHPFEQMQGLSQLAEGLDSLERGYLSVRDEHNLLQRQGAEISHFDPERELEGLIFQCGLRMEELKEQMEQMQQMQPTCEAPPSPPLHSAPLSVSSEGGGILTDPQSPTVPLLVDAGEAAAEEVSSASEDKDEEMKNEETLNSQYPKPLNDKLRRVDQDSAKAVDHYQSSKELRKLLDCSLRDGAPLPAAGRTDTQPEDEEKERLSQRAGNLRVHESLAQRKPGERDSPPVSTSKQWTSRSSPSHTSSSQCTKLPVHPSSSRGSLNVRKSHSSSLSSLGEISALERRNSKLQSGSSRVLSQDGIISPETDSGFVGSESSRLTPAAAPSPLHQRASESVSVPQEGNPGKPHTVPLSASPSSSPSHRHTAVLGSQLNPEELRRTRQGQRRRTLSCSPQHWVSQTDRRITSRTSEFVLESDSTSTLSEEEQNDRYTESISSLHSSSSCSSPAAQHHHGDSFRARSSSQVASRNDAIQMLQAEVTQLKEKLESCLRAKKPLSSVRAAPSAQENYTRHFTSTPRVRSEERRSDVSRGGRDRRTVDEVENPAGGRTSSKRRPSAHRLKPQPDLLTASEPQPQPLVSRCTQTTTAVPDSCRSHTNTVCSTTRPRQHSDASVQVCETADEPDSRSHPALVCPQCVSHQRGRPEGPVGGNREPTHSSRCPHCPLCGCPELYKSTEPDCRRVSDSPTHTHRQPAESHDGAARSRHFAAAAPPALLQCMPVCPPPLLLYPSPLYISPSNSTGKSLGVRGHREASGRRRRSLSADERRSVDGSLKRAIRAAELMKHTSKHMAHSMAAGLHYQELLTQSCSY